MDGYFDCHISCMSVVGYLRQQMFVCCRIECLVVTCIGWLRSLNGRVLCSESASAFAFGSLFVVMFATVVRDFCSVAGQVGTCWWSLGFGLGMVFLSLLGNDCVSEQGPEVIALTLGW